MAKNIFNNIFIDNPRQGGLLTVFHTVRRRSYSFSK